MTNGILTSEFMAFHDATWFLSCGQTVSENPTWLHEEAFALAPLVEQCKREIEAAAQKEGSYPLAPQDLDGSPASIFAALSPHRLYWTRSCHALYDRAVAADIARFHKETQLRDAHQRLVNAWLARELPIYGIDVLHGHGGFELIRPAVAEWYSEDEAGEIEVRDDAMFKHPAGAPGFSKRPMYRHLVIERRALISWASASGTETNATAEGVPPAGEGTVSLSPEHAPANISDPETRSPRQPTSASEQEPANAEPPIEADAADRGSTDTPESAATPVRTGLAGRPTSRDIILAEAERRLAAGDYPETFTAFTEELHDWFAGTQEGRRPEDRAPVPTARTLENPLRPLCRKHGVYQTRKISP
jgi:hypothetical protein